MGWIEQAKLKAAHRLKAMEASMPTMHGQFATDFNSAPGWREVGMEFTCIPDALHPWDAKIVSAIRRIDPSFVPVTIRWVFLSPHDTGNPQEEVFVRYGLARKVDDPYQVLPPMNVLMPTDNSLPRPNKLVVIFQGPRKKEKYCDLPGDFVPFDGNILNWFYDNYGIQSPEEVMAIIEQRRKAHEQKKRSVQSEMEYIQRDIEKYAQKMLDRVSEVEIKERLLGDRSKGSTPYVFLRK